MQVRVYLLSLPLCSSCGASFLHRRHAELRFRLYLPILPCLSLFGVGLRYHTQTDFKALFAVPIAGETVQFPAITLCPMSPGGVPGLQSEYWAYRTFPSTDVPPSQPVVLTKSYLYRGAVVSCLQHNWDMTNFDVATSTQSAMVIRFSMNLSAMTDPYMMTGAIGILHSQGVEPVFEDAPMFYSPLGQTTQVSILNYYVRNTKREPVNQYFVAVPAIISNHITGSTSNVSQVILAYNQFGYYIESEYNVYRSWNWIGEVGGAAALLFFLQHGILWAAIGCARRTCFRVQRKARKAEEAQEEEKTTTNPDGNGEDEHVDPATNTAADSTSAAPHTGEHQRTHSKPRRARRNRHPQQQSDIGPMGEVEMAEVPSQTSTTSPSSRKPRSPKTESGDRVVIDMADTLGESSH